MDPTAFGLKESKDNIEGWSAEPIGGRQKWHYIKDGRLLCNGFKTDMKISDTETVNLPGGCRTCKIALGIASAWAQGYSDIRRRGNAPDIIPWRKVT